MARNGKSINVKIATTKVIKALENKLAQIQKDKANQKDNEERFTKAHARLIRKPSLQWYDKC